MHRFFAEFQQWELALEAGGAALFAVDLELGEVRLSPQWWRLRGFEQPGDFSRSLERWMAEIHPEDRAEVERALHLWSRGDGSSACELRASRAVGGFSWLRMSGLAAKDRVSLIAGTLIDVTDRKRAEAMARGGGSLYELLSEHVGDLIIFQDAAGYFLDLSPSCRRILGYDPKELIGTNSFELLHPTTAARMTERRAQRETEAPAAGLELLQVRRKDGSYTWLEAAFTYLRGSDGQVTQLHAVARDVSSRLHAEEALAQSERLFRATFERAAIGLLHVDLSGRFVRVNPRICRLLGYEERELIGMTLLDVTHPESVVESVEAKNRMVLGAGSRWVQEKRYIRKDGTDFWAVATVSLVRNDAGEPDFFVVAVQDITERRELEEDLRQARDQLELRVLERTEQLSRANEELRREIVERERVEGRLKESEKLAATARLAAGVAHEINNPLGSIASAFALIRDAVPESHPYHRYVGRIDAEIERIADIVREMYGLYEPSQERSIRFDLAASVEDAMHLLETAAAARGVTLRASVPPEGLVVHLSENWVRRVVLNLLENAIDASPEGAEVSLRVEASQDDVRVLVRDHGAGIPPALRDQVFEPFFTTKGRKSGRGMGLGLSISRSLTEAMGGSLELRPAEGGGTEALASLPRWSAARSTPLPSSAGE